MRARDCCMRECRWRCFYYTGGGGRWDLLGCMHALLRAGCRITVYNPGITTYIESGARYGSAASDPSSSRSWMGSDKAHKARGLRAMRDRWLGRCRSRVAVTDCRDDESAGTTQAGHRAWRQISMLTDAPHLSGAHPQRPRSHSYSIADAAHAVPWREKCGL